MPLQRDDEAIFLNFKRLLRSVRDKPRNDLIVFYSMYEGTLV